MNKIIFVYLLIMGLNLYAVDIQQSKLAPSSYTKLQSERDFQTALDIQAERIFATRDPREMHLVVQAMIVILEQAQKKGINTVIPTKHDQLVSHMWDSFLEYAMTQQQGQPLMKKLVALDPSSYPFKADADVFPFRVIYAIGRDARPAQVDVTQPRRMPVSVQSDVETGMMWYKKPQEERMFPVLINGTIYQWIPNIFPTVRGNSMLVVYQKEWDKAHWQKQFLTRQHLENSFLLYSKISPEVAMGLNTRERGGASINDLHFQTVWLDQLPQNAQRPTDFKGDYRYLLDHTLDAAQEIVRVADDLVVKSFYTDFLSGFEFEGVNQPMVFDAVMKLIDSLHENNVHYNVIYFRGKIFVFLIHPTAQPSWPEGFEFFGVAEKIGLFMTLSESQYKRADTRDKIRELMELLRYPEAPVSSETRTYPGFDNIRQQWLDDFRARIGSEQTLPVLKPEIFIQIAS